MTKRTLPPPRPPVTDAETVLTTLGAWLQHRRGRRVEIEFTDHGWETTLHERRNAGGESLVDSMAQIAQVARLEGEETER